MPALNFSEGSNQPGQRRSQLDEAVVKGDALMNKQPKGCCDAWDKVMETAYRECQTAGFTAMLFPPGLGAGAWKFCPWCGHRIACPSLRATMRRCYIATSNLLRSRRTPALMPGEWSGLDELGVVVLTDMETGEPVLIRMESIGLVASLQSGGTYVMCIGSGSIVVAERSGVIRDAIASCLLVGLADYAGAVQGEGEGHGRCR